MGVSFESAREISSQSYLCGWCGKHVAASSGWIGEDTEWHSRDVDRWVEITLCPSCSHPTYHWRDRQVPGAAFGDPVEHLSPDVAALYEEARSSAGHGNYTAAVLVGRKLLMHIGVEKGAEEDKSFAHYVNGLAEEGIVTADMKAWVDEIRELGNDANHEIILMAKDEAEALLTFVSMLLRMVYEYPERGRRSVATRKAREAGVATADSAVDVVESDDIDFGRGDYPAPPPVLGS